MLKLMLKLTRRLLATMLVSLGCATITTSASAQEAVKQPEHIVDISRPICSPGCIIELDVSALKINEGVAVGMFKPSIAVDFEQHILKVMRLDIRLVVYILPHERGMPMFSNLALVREYMEGHNQTVRDANARHLNAKSEPTS